MKKFFQKKRLLSLFLSGVMIAGVMPTSVFAHQYEGVISSAYYDLNLPIEEREEEQRKRKELFDSIIKEDLELEISAPLEFNSIQAPRATFEELVENENLDAKIAEIEKENIKSPTGKNKWPKRSIETMLKNEKYTDSVKLLDSVNKENYYLLKDNHEATITEEVFNKVQKEKASRSNLDDENNRKSKKYSSKDVNKNKK